MALGAGLAGAQPPGWVKATVRGVRAGDAISAGQLAAIGAERIRDYEAFSIVRIPEALSQQAAEQARRCGLQLTIREEWDRVFMPGFAIDTRSPALPTAGVLASYPAGRGLYVVQFDAPLDERTRRQLADVGAQYVAYVPYNAALVVASQEAISALASSEGVSWTSIYHSAFRTRPARSLAGGELQSVVVQVAKVPGSEEVLARLDALQPEKRNSYLAYENVWIEASEGRIEELLADPYVVAIEQVGIDLPSGEREAIGITSTTTSATEPYQNGIRPFKPSGDYRTWLTNRGLLDTSGYRIAFADTGIDWTLPEIARAGLNTTSYVGLNGMDSYGHGTAVASVALGDPVAATTDGDGFYYGMGLAPKTKILAQQIIGATAPVTTELTWANDARNWGCTVQTHSHNEYFQTEGVYSQQAQEYDVAVRDTWGGDDGNDDPMPVTIAAGNVCGGSGDYRQGDCSTKVLSPATAKNVLTVGATESWRPNAYSNCATPPNRQPGDFFADSFKNVAYVSRRGTVDGRIKPDILAPGTLVSAASNHAAWFCNSADSYHYLIDTGTSFSAPQAAAAYVLLSKKRAATLSPAMLKAAVIGNAVSLKGGLDRYTNTTVAARPNAVQGFGRLNLKDALATSGVQQTYLDETAWAPFTGAGQSRSRAFTIANRAKPTIVVVAWTDAAALIGANPALVRDIDIEILRPDDCTGYTGNQMLTTEVSRVQGTGIGNCFNFVYDNRNNVEMIVLPANSLYTFDLDIVMTTWGHGYGNDSHNQKFAVYVSNAY